MMTMISIIPVFPKAIPFVAKFFITFFVEGE